MIKQILHKSQENLFDILIYISYFLIILSIFGISNTAPQYLNSLDYYVRVYICLFLIWRFNPFRTKYEFTDLDRKIAFSAGVFILTTTAINKYILYFKNKGKSLFNVVNVHDLNS
jgi:hypothetical protein